MCAGLHNQAPVAVVNMLHGRPGGHNPVRRPEGKVVQVLMQGMAGRLRARIRRLVDQHRMDGPDVRSGEALDVVQHLRQHDELAQHVVPDEILDLVEDALLRQPASVLQREVLHHKNAAGVDASVDQVHEALVAVVQQGLRHQVGNHQEAVLFIELPLAGSQLPRRHIVQGVAVGLALRRRRAADRVVDKRRRAGNAG